MDIFGGLLFNVSHYPLSIYHLSSLSLPFSPSLSVSNYPFIHLSIYPPTYLSQLFSDHPRPSLNLLVPCDRSGHCCVENLQHPPSPSKMMGEFSALTISASLSSYFQPQSFWDRLAKLLSKNLWGQPSPLSSSIPTGTFLKLWKNGSTYGWGSLTWLVSLMGLEGLEPAWLSPLRISLISWSSEFLDNFQPKSDLLRAQHTSLIAGCLSLLDQSQTGKSS